MVADIDGMVAKLSNYTYFASSVILDLEEATFDGIPVYDRYDEVISFITETIGIEAASLFARPEVTRANGAALTSVAWYTTRHGSAFKWSGVDPDTQSRAAAAIGSLIERLRPLLDDPTHGPWLQRWLNLPDLNDGLYLIENKPVLINWGLLPAQAADSPSQREALYRAGLGRFAEWLQVPPFRSAETLRAKPPAPPSPATAPPTAGAAAAPVAAGQTSAIPLVAGTTTFPNPVVYRRSWLPVLIAVIVAALILLVLLIPGVLVYPRLAAGPAIDTRQAEEVLRRRIADLESQAGNACVAPGPGAPANVAPPFAPAAAPLVVPKTDGPAPNEAEAAPTELPPSPVRVAMPAASPSDDTSTLVDVLDGAAVLVVGHTGNTIGTGSGFFVNATDVVTNRHVVEGSEPGKLFVVNKALGRLMPASVAAMTPSSEIASPDFAVVRLAAAPPAHGTLSLATPVQRAQNVLAYGYPAFVMQSDSQYQCLLQGGEGCVPVGSVTQGFITALQQGQDDLGLIIHSAGISEGNSGGPLVDYCGRVVGVNTFARRDAGAVQNLNFAQRAPALATFLKAASVTFATADSGCRLEPAPQTPAVPAAPSATQPAPAAAPPAASGN